jgi:regulator of protease activity HflC (stomatin/prohibitin superfamily)
MTLLIAAAITFLACFLLVPSIFWLLRFFGFYAIVPERTCYVYVLFGKVVAVIDEPGLHILAWATVRSRHAYRSAISAQPAGELGRGRTHGHRHLV